MRCMNISATQVIEALGGTAAVARLFDVAMPSVSAWKERGIPRPRMMFLSVAHKKKLAGIDLTAATALVGKPHTAPSATQGVSHG
jgi:hypothetical protein